MTIKFLGMTTFIFINGISIFFVDIVVGRWFIAKNNRQYYTHAQRLQSYNSNRVPDSMYHHGFIPNSEVIYHWDSNDAMYPLYVNSLGLVDRKIRTISQDTSRHRILFLGDSYTEGVGFPYEKTFVGLLEDRLNTNLYEVLNGGVQSYSPKIYLQKTKFLLEYKKIHIDQVIIFLDLSDIHNEFYQYRDFTPATELNTKYEKIIERTVLDSIKGFFIDNSIIVNSIYTGTVKKQQDAEYSSHWIPYELDYQAWTYDEMQYKTYGKYGLELSSKYLSNLVELLRTYNINNIVLAVYPWPQQIKRNDLNSLQVTYWRTFSEKHSITFLNLFPVFFENQLKKNLYLTDDHFNEDGHRLVVDSILNEKIIPIKSQE